MLALRPAESAQAARAPRQAAACATGATGTGNEPKADPAATESDAEPAATTAAAATNSAAAATATAAAATTATAASVTTAATATSAGYLHAAPADVFLVEEIKRGETDVSHFLFAKNEALIGHGIAGLWDVGRGRRGCGCAADQRQTQSCGPQHMDAASFALASFTRSLFDP
jgi:hypothetical protein